MIITLIITLAAWSEQKVRKVRSRKSGYN